MDKMTHNISLGSLVETSSEDTEGQGGLRLFVVGHYFDFDGVPLYRLSHNKEFMGKEQEEYALKEGEESDYFKIFYKGHWSGGVSSGWPENWLTVIKEG